MPGKGYSDELAEALQLSIISSEIQQRLDTLDIPYNRIDDIDYVEFKGGLVGIHKQTIDAILFHYVEQLLKQLKTVNIYFGIEDEIWYLKVYRNESCS